MSRNPIQLPSRSTGLSGGGFRGEEELPPGGFRSKAKLPNLRRLFLDGTKRRRRRKARIEQTESLETRELLAADLMGTRFNADEPLQWGQRFNVDGTIYNGGDRDAGWSQVKFYMSDNPTISKYDVYLGSRWVSPIGSGRSARFDNHSLRLPSSPPAGFTSWDDVHFGMIVDAGNHVRESSGRNNRNRGLGWDKDRVSISPRSEAKANLIGTRFDSTESLEWGNTFTVNGSLMNNGRATAGASTARIYVSSDSNITASDHYLTSISVPSLGAGQEHRFQNVQVRLPALPFGFTATDDVFIGIIMDADGQVSESSEGDNANRGNGRDRDRVRVTLPQAGDSNDQLQEGVWLGNITEPKRHHRGVIDNGLDVDMFSFNVVAGQEVEIDLDRLDNQFDSYIRLFDVTGRELSWSDDNAAPGETRHRDSYLKYRFASSGTYYVAVSGYGNQTYDARTGSGDRSGSTGAYMLEVRPVVASSTVHIAPTFHSAAYRGSNGFRNRGYAPRRFYSNPNSSRLGVSQGNCTWYAEGRLRQLAGVLGIDTGRLSGLRGHAKDWESRTSVFRSTSTPQVGAVAQWDRGTWGHVAVVEQVNADGSIVISESSYIENPRANDPNDVEHRTRTIRPGAGGGVFTAWPTRFLVVK